MRRIRPTAAVIGLVAAAGILTIAAPAAAHGFTSVVYADVTAQGGTVVSELKLEYDLLIVSAADAEDDDSLFDDGTYAFEAQDAQLQVQALEDHIDSVAAYVTAGFTAAVGGEVCPARLDDELEMTLAEGVPYVRLTVVSDCAPTNDGHVITSTLFGDDEGYVRDTKAVVTYDLDLQHGSAALDAQHPSFDTEQTGWERFWSFFALGAEHLLTGIDHILFLLALIVGSRRLREIVLAATSFTIAHSVTFILAAVGVVSVPAVVVEPIIALSIAVVAAWYLLRLGRKREHVDDLSRRSGPLGLDRSGWLRLAVVFVFGLVHGLGFAAALGIDQPWSWTLLWSLLVFNLGIEAVQIGIILAVFPLLVLLRRKAPKTGMWVAGIVAAGVTAAGLYWFVERLLGA
ncbi:hydrogenase/urease accessory protein HupE [Microbacterium natoriense]|uniref:Hydrogenase/urease accessory protein HupE n=1 Tax=Microbacterium natoriense TaxID=284570 RepID=A0AAW8ERJ4_9MICO|nr:HupE/UreJ family protein [Microbacterium natoriense]MDQ0645888.1 hydrogenase/urease accessory protein HupE [Microbacterium natoriense]